MSVIHLEMDIYNQEMGQSVRYSPAHEGGVLDLPHLDDDVPGGGVPCDFCYINCTVRERCVSLCLFWRFGRQRDVCVLMKEGKAACEDTDSLHCTLQHESVCQ